MKTLRNFVIVSSLVLSAWLAVTFVQDVPPHRYPSLGRLSKASAAAPVAPKLKDRAVAAVRQQPEREEATR